MAESERRKSGSAMSAPSAGTASRRMSRSMGCRRRILMDSTLVPRERLRAASVRRVCPSASAHIYPRLRPPTSAHGFGHRHLPTASATDTRRRHPLTSAADIRRRHPPPTSADIRRRHPPPTSAVHIRRPHSPSTFADIRSHSPPVPPSRPVANSGDPLRIEPKVAEESGEIRLGRQVS